MIIKDKKATTLLEYEGDKFKITRFDDVTDIATLNKEMRKDVAGQNGFSADREWRWIGEIPMAIYMDHYRKYPEARDPSGDYWRKWLSRSENEPFRTVPKILGGKTKYA